MSRVMNWSRGATLLTAIAAATACTPDVDIVGTETPDGGSMFRSYVAMGNSITAGYQSSGINATTQQASYANLFAQQVGTRFAMPLLAAPGCPPPMVTLTSRGGTPPYTGTTCALRDNASVTAVLNNVAVPGAFSIDPTVQTSGTSNFLTTLILGGKSQVQRAIEADPTFVSIWVGNNDVLSAATSGFMNPTPNVTPGLTPLATFQANYDAMMSELVAGAPGVEGILVGVANVPSIPHFIPAPLLYNAQYLAGLSAIAGTAITPHPVTCSPTSTSLIGFAILGAIRAGTHPAVISCDKSTSTATTPGYGEAYVLDAADLAVLSERITAYNQHIAATAAEYGFAYLDPNPILAAQRQPGGCIPPYPNLAAINPTTGQGNPFGPCISLDGVHPATPGHELIADAVIAEVNSHYGTAIPALP